jgi:hypothetical protein
MDDGSWNEDLVPDDELDLAEELAELLDGDSTPNAALDDLVEQVVDFYATDLDDETAPDDSVIE